MASSSNAGSLYGSYCTKTTILQTSIKANQATPRTGMLQRPLDIWIHWRGGHATTNCTTTTMDSWWIYTTINNGEGWQWWWDDSGMMTTMNNESIQQSTCEKDAAEDGGWWRCNNDGQRWQQLWTMIMILSNTQQSYRWGREGWEAMQQPAANGRATVYPAGRLQLLCRLRTTTTTTKYSNTQQSNQVGREGWYAMQQPATPRRRWTLMTMCRTMTMTVMIDNDGW